MQLSSVQPINQHIENLQQEIITEIDKRSASDSLSAIISIKALQNIADRLRQIQQILNIQRYNLIFIGQVGAGKTTAICHLFNLVRKVKETRTKGTKLVEVTKVKEILSTGSGKTTICEVVIKHGLITSIEIDPYEQIELARLIEEFGQWIWQKTHPEATKERVEIPPDELLRAIRNIVELPETLVAGKMRDRALEFASEFSIDEYPDFQQQLLHRGRLELRIATEISPTESDLDQRLWLNQIFQALNVAKLLNFSIPKRIYINLPQELLDLTNHPRFGSIIDTRGLDLATKDRRDLGYYIRETNDSICIFTERFPAAPSNVIQIIGKYLTKTAQDIDTKIALLVMPRKGEPEKVIGANGQAVDDIIAGIALRKANIDNVFNNEEISFPFNNILFYDALQAYLGDGSLDLYYDQSDIELDRERIFTEIDRLIDDRETRLIEEISTLADQFQQIARGNNLDQIEGELVIDAVKKLDKFSDLAVLNRQFSSGFMEMLPEHHCTLRATNNRYGEYPLGDIDIYFNGRYLAETLARNNTQLAKLEILKLISNIEAEIDGDSTLNPLLQRLRNQIDENYETFSIDLSNEIETILSEETFAPRDYDCEFWQNTINRWGQGSGYKVDVLSLYLDRIETIDQVSNTLIELAWRDRVIQPILTFLGEAK